MRKTYNMMILLMAMYILICPINALENQSIKGPVTYRVIIDQNYGFYRIYEIHDKISSEDINAENGVLNISKGDTVVLINGGVADNLLTIISDEQLWNDEEVILKYSGKEFSYTFDNSGIYNIYIKEHPQLKQRIIVDPINVSINTTYTNVTGSNVSNDTEPSQTKVTESNVSNDTELNQTNITEPNVINDTEINQTNITDASSAITKKKSVQITVLGKSSTFVRTAILLAVLTSSAIYFLSARIKEK